MRFILIVLAYPLQPLIRTVKRVKARVRRAKRYMISLAETLYYSATLPFYDAWYWIVNLLPKRKVEVRTVVVRRDDDWDRNGGWYDDHDAFW